MIFTITGPSASGKTTLMRGIIDARKPNVQPLESVTTRAPREGDVPGEYRYAEPEMFDAFLSENAFLWHVEAHGNRYGTRKQTVDNALESGVHVALLTIEGVRPLLEYAMLSGKQSAVRSVYLRVDSEENLHQRLTLRGDAPADVDRRVADCRTWNTQAQSAGIRFRVIESTLPRDTVLAQALRFMDAPQQNKRPSLS